MKDEGRCRYLIKARRIEELKSGCKRYATKGFLRICNQNQNKDRLESGMSAARSATTSSMNKETRLCHCVSCELKLNSKSLGRLMEASMLLSVGTETLSVLGQSAQLYNWNRGSNVSTLKSNVRPHKLDWKLNIGYARCRRNRGFDQRDRRSKSGAEPFLEFLIDYSSVRSRTSAETEALTLVPL